MDRIAVETTQVLVVADGDSTAAVSNKRGHLFEQFVAQLLGALGYEEPRTDRLNVTSDGIEIDVEARQKVTGHALIAECKTYSANVRAELLSAFLGKYGVQRMKDPNLVGLFVALPRLTANGVEQAREAEAVYDGFRHLGSYEVVELLENAKLLPPDDHGPSPRTDLTVVISEHGLALAAKALDARSRKATKVVVWAARTVPDPVLDLVSRSPLADGLAVVRQGDEASAADPRAAREPPTIIAVRGSSADFEYQLPAAPKYFVGRKSVASDLGRRITDAIHGQTVVINAKSGWGKSSLALHLAKRVEQARGVSLVVDSRTADRADFVPAVLERLADEASGKRILDLPDDAAFSSLLAAVRTLGNATPRGKAKPLLLFFDQFENVFRDESLTRSFRDLALLVQELALPLTVAFAWKTDLVGWTEGHPYQLRDEIRGSATVVPLEPLGPKEIGTLLDRLGKAAEQRLQKDLRQRLREYSQGLPWLFKKLGGHILGELRAGIAQDHLVREGLNVQTLFAADLAELSPAEEEALRRIAQSAPVAVSDLEESVPSPILQSLLNMRLVVQVGERIDTYWDTFRDYLVTGKVAVEDTYTVRYGPASVGKLLRKVVAAGGTLTVPEAAEQLNTSPAVIFNLSRELRQLGLMSAEANRLDLDPALIASADPEGACRDRAAAALRRHKIFSIINGLLAENNGPVSLVKVAAELPAAFPAVEAKEESWITYARSFVQWLAYAGLASLDRDGVGRVDSDAKPDSSLLAGATPVRVRGVFPQTAAGPSIELLLHLADPANKPRPQARRSQSALRDLSAIGAVALDARDNVTLTRADLVSDGAVSGEVLNELARKAPGVADGFSELEMQPWLTPLAVGGIIRAAVGAEWKEATTISNGKYLRSWAKACGIETRLKPPGAGHQRGPLMAAPMAASGGDNAQETMFPAFGESTSAAEDRSTPPDTAGASG
jgi:hypothetical protein